MISRKSLISVLAFIVRAGLAGRQSLGAGPISQDRINLVFISRFSSSPSCQHRCCGCLAFCLRVACVGSPVRSASNCKSVAKLLLEPFSSPLPPSIILKLFNLSRHFLIRPSPLTGVLSRRRPQRQKFFFAQHSEMFVFCIFVSK